MTLLILVTLPAAVAIWLMQAKLTATVVHFPCYYCWQKGHVMSECHTLQKKNEKSKSDIIVTQPGKKNSGNIPEEYVPFISQGCVSFLDSPSEKPVTILRDTGTSQSLVLDDVLAFSSQSDTGMTVLLQGVELGTYNVPLHKICLKSALVKGPVVIGVRPFLSVKRIDLILGNDLAGGKVVASPQVSQMPCDDEMMLNTREIPKLFSTCAVTQAMSRATPNQPTADASMGESETASPVAVMTVTTVLLCCLEKYLLRNKREIRRSVS